MARAVRGDERDRDDLAALARDRQRPVTTLEPKRLDVGTERFGHPQPVDGQQRHQRMLGRRRKPSREEQRTHLIAIQPGGMGLVTESRSANMRGRRPLQQALLLGIPVGARHHAQAARHGRPGAPADFETMATSLARVVVVTLHLQVQAETRRLEATGPSYVLKASTYA